MEKKLTSRRNFLLFGVATIGTLLPGCTTIWSSIGSRSQGAFNRAVTGTTNLGQSIANSTESIVKEDLSLEAVNTLILKEDTKICQVVGRESSDSWFKENIRLAVSDGSALIIPGVSSISNPYKDNAYVLIGEDRTIVVLDPEDNEKAFKLAHAIMTKDSNEEQEYRTAIKDEFTAKAYRKSITIKPKQEKSKNGFNSLN